MSESTGATTGEIVQLVVTVLTFIMTIVGPYVLDKRAQKLQRQRQDKEKILERAEKIHAEVTKSMGVLHYYMAHHAMNAAVRKSKKIYASDAPRISEEDRMTITRELQEYEETDKINWSKYNEAMDEWLSFYPHHWGQVNYLFGNKNKESLQKIHGLFSQAGSMLRATYYNRRSSMCVEGKENSTAYYDIVRTEGKFGRQKGTLTKEIERLNNSMVVDLTNEKVGFLRDRATEPKSCKCCPQVCFWRAAEMSS